MAENTEALVGPSGLTSALCAVSWDTVPTSVSNIRCNWLQRTTSTRVHVMAKLRGRPICCLLDSGCNHSVIGHRFIKGMRLKHSDCKLSAANWTPLPISGDMELQLRIDGHDFKADVSILPVLGELLLGSDWLVANCFCWDFVTGMAHLGD